MKEKEGLGSSSISIHHTHSIHACRVSFVDPVQGSSFTKWVFSILEGLKNRSGTPTWTAGERLPRVYAVNRSEDGGEAVSPSICF